MKKLRTGVLAVLWPVLNSYAQPPSNIRSLTVGDIVPDIALTSIFNYSVPTVHLSDLKSKLVILDFWGRYCSSCILALGKMDSLQKMFKEQIQIFPVSDFDNKDELDKSLKRFKQTKDLKLPILLQDSILSEYFPHTMVSHVVWIDATRKVKAITGSEYVTQENIQSVLDGKDIQWPVKNDRLDFDYQKPLLDFSFSELKSELLYYSTLTGHLEGVSAPLGTYIDSSQNAAVTIFFNRTLPELCQLALDYRLGAKPAQFVLHVKDRSRYFKSKEAYSAEWGKANTYSYYLRCPIGLTEEKQRAFVQADLLRWLSTLGITVQKEIRLNGQKKQTVYLISEGIGKGLSH